MSWELYALALVSLDVDILFGNVRKLIEGRTEATEFIFKMFCFDQAESKL